MEMVKEREIDEQNEMGWEFWRHRRIERVIDMDIEKER